MKKIVLLFPLLLLGQSFNDIQKEITNSLKYKIQQKKIEIYAKKFNQIKAKNYGNLDFSYNYIHFLTQPVLKTNTNSIHIETPMSNNNHYISQLKYSYPLFTGYNITNSINKSKIELIKQKLTLKNIKRELLLQSANLYSNIYALKNKINALKIAKTSLESAKDKAIGFYKAGLLNKSNVDEITAKYYEIIADIQDSISQKNNLLNNLSYILNTKIDSITKLPTFQLNKPNFQNRADVKIIKQTLKIANTQIKIANSSYYPKIGLEIGIKREGDNAILTNNYYQNVDKSYISLGINYNIFDGGIKKATSEIARLNKVSETMFYNDYLNSIKTNYKNDIDTLQSLKFSLKSATAEIKARQSYYSFIKARFNEGLSDATDLNDAIAKLANAKAKKSAIQAKIFFETYKLKLNGGYFEQ